MNCDKCQEQLVAYAEELLDAATAEAVRDHLAECAACRAEEAATRRLRDRLAAAGAGTTFVSLEEGILGEIRKRQARVSRSAFDAGPSRGATRRIALPLAAAACLLVGLGAALVAWWSRPWHRSDPRRDEGRPLNSIAVEDRSLELRAIEVGAAEPRRRSRFEAALEALIAAGGDDDEALNQGLQVCWSEYANDVGDGSSLQ